MSNMSLKRARSIFYRGIYMPIVLLAMPYVVYAQKIRNPIPNVPGLPDFIDLIITFVMLVMTPILVVAIIYAGFLLVTARGDEKKLVLGKVILLWTLVGAAIILGAKGIAIAVKGTMEPFFQI